MADASGFGQWLARETAQRLTQALESMTGGPMPAAVSRTTGAEPPETEPVLWWEHAFALAPDAPFWIGAPASAWEGIGKKVLEAAGLDDATLDDCRSTYFEILQQTIGGVAQSLTVMAGREAAGGSGKESARPAGLPLAELKVGERGELVLLVASAPGLSAAAEVSREPAPAAPAASESRASSPGPSAPAPSAPAGMPANIQVLYDVELPVAVSFGRAFLALKEVLKLTSGSIVELNRTVTETVDVIVNNCVIARGEVVVVEGNYGVRITEIVSRNERLQSVR